MERNTSKCMEDHVIEDVHKLCRLCLSEPEASLPIFNSNIDNMCVNLEQRIFICVGIQVSWDDCLPNMVCTECYKELERYHLFRRKCEDTNQKLILHAQAIKESKTLLIKKKSFNNNESKIEYGEVAESVDDNDSAIMFINKEHDVEIVKTELKNLIKNFEDIEHSVEERDNATNLQLGMEPNFEGFLSTVLLQLGVVKSKDNKLTLMDQSLTTLELETGNGKFLVELMEEEQDIEHHELDHKETLEASMSLRKYDGRGNSMRNDSERTRCEECGKQFTTRSVLARHMRVHSGERPHACRVCKRRFAQRSVMLRHEFVHREQRPHQCQQCPKSFTQRSALKAHARTHASTPQAFNLHPCTHCSKVFLYASGLSRHMRVHNGLVFACGECARPFRDKSSLLRHERNARHRPRTA